MPKIQQRFIMDQPGNVLHQDLLQDVIRGRERENPISENDRKNGEEEMDVEIHIPKRKIIVEPILIIMAMSDYPLSLITSLYSYQWFKQDVAQRTGFDLDTLEKSNGTSCGEVEANKSGPQFKFIEEVADLQSFYENMTKIVRAAPALFSTIYLATYSDRAGRKWAILPPIVFGLISAIVHLAVINLKMSVWIFLGTEFLISLGGSTTIGVYAYVSDQSRPRDRRFRISVVEMTMFFSGIFGPIGFGYWIKKSGYFYPILVTIGGHVLNILYIIFFVPDTVKRKTQKRPKFFSLMPFKRSMRMFLVDNGTNRRWKLLNLYIAVMFVALAYSDSFTSRLELNPPLCWDSVTIGYYKTVEIGTVSVGGITAAWLFGFCTTDAMVALISGIAGVFKEVYRGFIRNTIMMFVSPVFSAFSMLFFPTLRALMSQHVDKSEQGSIYGTISFGESILRLFAGFLFNIIYAKTIWITPGFVYFTLGICYLGACVTMIVYIRRLRKEEKYKRLTNESDTKSVAAANAGEDDCDANASITFTHTIN